MENRIARFVDELVHDPAFLARYPYYAAILARLHPVEDPSVETMGLSLHHGRFYLHANVEALSREPRFVRGILLHEIHHLVLGHLTDPSYRAFEKKELGQVAMETSANEHVEEPLPTPILWQHFERFGFRAGQSTRERYELLCKAEAEAQRPMPRPGTDEVDDHSWSEQQLPPGATEHVRRLVVESVEEARERAEASAEKRAKLLAGKTPDRLLLELFGTSLPPRSRSTGRPRSAPSSRVCARPCVCVTGRTDASPSASSRCRAAATNRARSTVRSSSSRSTPR